MTPLAPGVLAPQLPAFPRLFSPLAIGPLELRNRIVSPPHGTGFAEGGLPSDRQVAYYEARARGGVGLIVVGPKVRNVPKEGYHAWDPGGYIGLYQPDTFWVAK